MATAKNIQQRAPHLEDNVVLKISGCGVTAGFFCHWESWSSVICRLWAFLIGVIKCGRRWNLKFTSYPDQVSPDKSLWRLTTVFAFIIFMHGMVHVWVVSLIACLLSSRRSPPKNNFEICHPFLVKALPKIFSKSDQNTFFLFSAWIGFCFGGEFQLFILKAWPFRGSSAQNIIWNL